MAWVHIVNINLRLMIQTQELRYFSSNSSSVYHHVLINYSLWYLWLSTWKRTWISNTSVLNQIILNQHWIIVYCIVSLHMHPYNCVSRYIELSKSVFRQKLKGTALLVQTRPLDPLCSLLSAPDSWSADCTYVSCFLCKFGYEAKPQDKRNFFPRLKHFQFTSQFAIFTPTHLPFLCTQHKRERYMAHYEDVWPRKIFHSALGPITVTLKKTLRHTTTWNRNHIRHHFRYSSGRFDFTVYFS